MISVCIFALCEHATELIYSESGCGFHPNTNDCSHTDTLRNYSWELHITLKIHMWETQTQP